MTIKVYKNLDNLFACYTVVVDKDVFAMSEQPLNERGINQYVGPLDSYDFSKSGEVVTYNDIPEMVRQAIRMKCDNKPQEEEGYDY